MAKEKNKKKLFEKTNEQNEFREEKHTPLDKYKDQKFADEIPLKDLKIDSELERNKHKTQEDSQSAKEYRTK